MAALLRSLVAALTLLLGGAAPPLAHLGSCFVGKPRVAHPRWMTALDGKRLLSELSIPGTHNSCARRGGPLAECQRWSVPEQLAAGIRFLDIRCRHCGAAFDIHHGPFYQKITFAKVRDQCEAFLAANPGECVLMSVKEEYLPGATTKTFAGVFKDYLAGHGRRWHTGATIPRLADVRGKIVLVAREGGIGGIPWASLDVQDQWDIKAAWHISAKWAKVKAHLHKTARGPTGRMFVNFSSASSSLGLAWPSGVASSVNRSLHGRLASHRSRTGVLVMDFPGEALIARILEKNAGSQPPARP